MRAKDVQKFQKGKIVGECNEGITKYIMVTPAGMTGYLSSRIVIPAVFSGVVALFCIPLFSLVELSLFYTTVMVISTVLSGIVTAMLVVAVSSNKEEGMAIGKLSGSLLFLMIALAEFFVWIG